jgi:hypothetical protein
VTSFRRGRVPQKEQRQAAKLRHPSNSLCFWCHASAPDSFYRSPIEDIPGGRLIVCGPECPDRPDGARVFTIGADWANGWTNEGGRNDPDAA